MANMELKKTEMPTQEPLVRARNFDEVALGYTEEMALREADRCLGCKNMPCVNGCPVNIHIPEFISKVKEGDFEAAYEIISASSSLPAVCGRVCPQESQCEAKCIRGIKGEPVGIGRLERFVADWHNTFATAEPVRPESNGHRVAVVGSGPSGLTCAGDLAKKGYEVSVFEALHTAGGVLVYGIPEFRLPKAIVKKEVDNLIAMGVNVESLRFVSLLLASMITAVCVSFLGVIGFVGIICPHVTKKLLGQDHRVTIPVSCLMGSLLLLLADTMSRSLGSGSALPVGAITSLLGAPFFIAIIFSRKENHKC